MLGLLTILSLSLHQFLNGWCQNIDAYTHQPPLGQYFNLNACY